MRATTRPNEAPTTTWFAVLLKALEFVLLYK